MSRFLGGERTTQSQADGFLKELDHDLSRASANMRPFLRQVSSFDCVFNRHVEQNAGGTISKVVEVGPKDIVFMEICKIKDGEGVEKVLDDSLSKTSPDSPPKKLFGPDSIGSYARLITTALGARGCLTFPVDARWTLFKEIEAISGEDITDEFLSHDRRFTPKAIDSMPLDELIEVEVTRLLKHSFIMESRDKTALLQMISLITGLLNRDDELLELMGLSYTQITKLMEHADGHQGEGLSLGSVYGFHHIGLHPLIKGQFPQAKAHHLVPNVLPYNRRTYGGLYTKKPAVFTDRARLEEIAAASIVEDIFCNAAHYPDIFGALPATSDYTRKIVKIAKDTSRASGGAFKLLETLSSDQACRILEDKGLVFRL